MLAAAPRKKWPKAPNRTNRDWDARTHQRRVKRRARDREGGGDGNGGPILPPYEKLPAGVALAFLSDSMGARGNNFTTSSVRTTAENRHNSEVMWVHARKPKFVFQNWWDSTANAAARIPDYGASMASDTYFSGLNFGYSGDTATGAKRRVAQVIASGAKVCVVALGTNVGTTDGEASVTIAALQWIVETLTAAGIRVIIMTIRPRRVSLTPTGSEISPANMGRIITINAAIRANWEAWGAHALADPWNELRDPAYNEGDQLYGTIFAANAIADGVHLSSRGAYVSSLVLEAAIDAVIEDGIWFNDLSNMLTNGEFTGTSGVVGGGFTAAAENGGMPTGWTIQNAQGAGQPVTGTVATVDGDIILTINSSGAGTANAFNTIRINPSTTISNANFVSTDWLCAAYEFEVVTPGAILVMGQATLGQTSTISARGHGQPTSTYNSEPSPMKDFAMNFWFMTEPLLAEARTNVNPRLDLAIRVDVAGTCTVKIKRAKLVKVPNPQTSYPWIPTVDPLPTMTNLIPSQDLSTWTATGVTVGANNVITETTDDSSHDITIMNISRSAGSKPMRLILDIKPDHTRRYIRLRLWGDQFFDGANGFLDAIYDLQTMALSSVFNADVDADFTNVFGSVFLLPRGNKRVVLDFTTPATGAGFTIMANLGTGPVPETDYSYVGSTSQQITIQRAYLYDQLEVAANYDSIVQQNLRGYHEGLAYGVPEAYGWYTGFYKPLPAAPTDMTAMTGWGTIYPQLGSEGTYNPASARCEIRNMKSWVRDRYTKLWLPVQDQTDPSNAIVCGDYPDDLVGEAFDLPVTDEGGGVASIPLPPLGRTYHWWPGARGTFSKNRIDAMYVEGDFRLTADEDAVMIVAGDWWLNATAPFNPDFSANPAAGSGNWVKLTTTFRTIGFYSTNDSAEFVANPPSGSGE